MEEKLLLNIRDCIVDIYVPDGRKNYQQSVRLDINGSRVVRAHIMERDCNEIKIWVDLPFEMEGVRSHEDEVHISRFMGCNVEIYEHNPQQPIKVV